MPKLIRYEDFLSTSDAAFRAWVSLAESMLAAAGFVRTADAGQIDPATAVRPSATYTYAGYAIWRLNDPLQAVAPVFIKIQYGTGNNSTFPGLFVEIGSGSNGAGALTGSVAGARSFYSSASVVAASLNMAVANDWGGALILALIPGASSSGGIGFGFAVHRTVDAEGAPTSEGVMLNVNGTATASSPGLAIFSQRVPSEQVVSMTGTDIAHFPFALAGYSVGVSPQIFPTWCALPKVKPMAFLSVAPATSSPNAGQTFSMAVVGSQPRTYISIGPALARQAASSASNLVTNSFIMWED